jgi:chromosomal replication initiator protein
LAEAADGYRTLEGWLARLELTARVERRAIDEALVAALFAEETPPCSAPADAATLSQVVRAVAERFGVTLRELRGPTRRQVVAGPRHLAMHLARAHTDLSFQAIGAYFGGRDPATVRYACRAAAARIAADPALAAVVAPLRRRWREVRPDAESSD